MNRALENNKKKGVYIVSEKGCMTENSGANKHISIGMKELASFFNIKILLLFDTVIGREAPKQSVKKEMVYLPVNRFKGTLKDLFLLYQNHRRCYRFYKQIKKENPAFIYERAAYMNFTGLVASKLLNIPHFYEVNGVLSTDIKMYYNSFVNRLFNSMMLYSYKKSTAAFYVGGINHYLGLNSKTAYSVQNGIESAVLDKFVGFKRKNNYDRIRVVFIGHAMQHHGLDFYCKAIHLLKYKEHFEFTFIGMDTGHIRELLPEDVSCQFLGAKGESEIYDLISDFDIGIIPSTPEYGSNMKLFLYGAAKLAVIAPTADNFVNTFSDNQLIFFKKNEVNALADKLDDLVRKKVDYVSVGEALYELIREKYTWDKIFKFESEVILNEIEH